ncbi:hypothetical protein Btru_005262 [Bulinus truncatus]|nr:hypothetical protein Btru_005262 [Bulinus truncatus]
MATAGRGATLTPSSHFTVKFVETVWPWIDFCFYCLFPFIFMLTCDVIITRQLLHSERTMASHKRRMFFRRRTTGKIKSHSVTSGRQDQRIRSVQDTRARCHERHAEDTTDGIVSTSTAELQDVDRGSLRSDVSSKGALMTLSVLQHRRRDGHLVPACLNAPNTVNGDGSGDFNQVELHAYQLSATYISNVVRHTPLVPSGQVCSVTPLDNLTFRREDDTSKLEPSLNNISYMNSLERVPKQQRLSPINLTADQNCFADVRLKDAVSPSNVNTSFTFVADEDDVLLTENVRMRKKKSANVSDIRRRFSCKVHPVESESDPAEICECFPIGDNSDEQIPEVNLGTSFQSKDIRDSQCMKEACGEDSLNCNQINENGTSEPNKRNSAEEYTCILFDGDNNTNANEILRPVNHKIKRAPKNGATTPDISNRNSSINSDPLQFSRRTTASISKTLLAVTVTFWVLNAPIVIFIIGYTYWAQIVDERKRARLTLAWAVVNFLQYLNNAIHFFLYCLTGPKFRQELFALFRCVKKSKDPPVN